jgi:acyl-CoA thioesterase-1
MCRIRGNAVRQGTAIRSLAVSLIFVLAGWAGVDAAASKIMPVGDSRTAGPDSPDCYRIYLDSLLKAGGYSFDLVGYRTKHVSNNPVGNYDSNHQGMWGWVMQMLIDGHPDHVMNDPATDELGGHIGIWARRLVPDVALCLLGGIEIPRTPPADLTAMGKLNDTIFTRIGKIIDSLRVGNPKVTILLGNVYPFGPNDARMWQDTVLNARFPGYVATKTTAASPVVLVDTYTGFNRNTMMYDDQHANGIGCRLIAQRWYQKLQAVYATSTLRDHQVMTLGISGLNCEGVLQPWRGQTAFTIIGRMTTLQGGTQGIGVRVLKDSPSLRILTIH